MTNITVEGLIEKAGRRGIGFILEGDTLRLRVLRQEDVEQELLNLIAANKEVIKAYLSQRPDSTTGKTTNRRIWPAADKHMGMLPLSFSQERLWFVDSLHGSVQYNMPYLFRLNGKLNIKRLEMAFRAIVGRHEILRTVVREKEGVGYQELKPAEGWEMQLIDHTACVSRAGSLSLYLEQLMYTRFDLSADYMLRVSVITQSPENHVLVVVMHHIAADGWSMGIMAKELSILYNQPPQGNGVLLSPLEIQFADYAVWQRKYFTNELLSHKLQYWKQQLKDLQPLELPSDYARPHEQSSNGNIVIKYIDKDLQKALIRLSEQQGVTLFMTLLGAFHVLLYRYTGQTDIYVGSPVAGRQHQELEGLIGFFVNTVVLRSRLHENEPFAGLLQRMKEITLSAYEHQEVPFEKIVEALGHGRDLSRHPVFQVLFNVQNDMEEQWPRLDDLHIIKEEAPVVKARYDVGFDITNSNDGLQLALTYCSDLYKEERMKKLLDHYEQLLISVTANCTSQVSGINILTPSEEHLLRHAFNDTYVPVSNETFPELFEAQVQRTPTAAAVLHKGKQLTYRELDMAASQLAHYLKARGVQPETPVPLCVDRGVEMLVGIIGILKAGACYVPIDPAYPAARINYMLKDTNAGLVVTMSAWRDLFTEGEGVEPVCLDDDWPAIMETRPLPMHERLLPGRPAYIIYTSGSTGLPKGVMIGHHSLANFLAGMILQLELSHSPSILAVTTYCFDISCLELFLPLVMGGQVYIADRDDVSDGRRLHSLISKLRPALMQATPSTWQLLLESGWRNEEEVTILTGGEALPDSLKDNLVALSPAAVWNMYGPTETTIWSASKLLIKEEKVNIGRPIANTQIYIVDKAGMLCPVGITGELCIGGAGVAKGYLNRPELTTEKFIANPFGQGRLYRTGDLARWLPDGNLEYLGRMDDQVKLRGYRIEPGEVEHVLAESPGVKQAVVVVSTATHPRLIGYVVATENYNSEAVQHFLSSKLPAYMVPSLLVELDSIPLTHNGKVDRKQLAALEHTAAKNKEYTAPRNEPEAALAAIWEQLLNVTPIGIDDNFFELGGHSLMAMRMAAAVRKITGREMSVRDIFLHPTIAALSGLIAALPAAQTLPSITKRTTGGLVPLSYAQERLWFIDRLQGSQAYHMPFVFRLEGNLSLPVLINSLQAVLNRHEVLRTVIREQEGQGYQFLLEAAAWQPELLTQTEAMLRYGSLDNCITAVINRPFDLGNDYPLRVCLITLAENEHILISVLHHIAADGWSMGLLVEELSILYRSGLNGARPALTPLPLQYADYALWQREYLSSGRLQSGISYWQAQLKALSAFTLTPDHPRTEAALLPGGVVRRLLAPGLHERLVQLSHSAGVSLFMLLLAAFKVLLHRYSGERDITVGSSTAGRPYQEVEGLIGFFINTLVLRSTIDPQQLFWQYLMECKNTILNAYAHQEVPFDKMVELAGSSRHRGRNPLYEILFTVQNNEDRGSLSLEGLQVSRCVPQTVSAQFDLNFNVSEQPDGLQLDMIYRSDLYKQERMLALLHHYGHLLESIVSNPRRQIGHMEIMGPDEQERLKLFARGALVEQSPLSLPQLFSAAAAHNMDAVAVIFKEEQLTYGQLEARSNQLAHYLRSRGVTEGALVPLCMERCTNMPVAILAIMKAGAAYVPIDPEQPLDRITYLLEDTAAAHVVTQSACTALFNGAHQLICIDDGEVNNALARQPATPPAVPLSSDRLAYIIYTSGSTGRPKGVMVTQANLVNYLQYGKARYMDTGLQTGSGSYVYLPYTFDASLTALFVPLISGRRIVLSSSSATDVFEDNNFRAFAPYDFIKLTPAHLPLLLSTLQQWGLKALTSRLVIGGEALHTAELAAYQQAQIQLEVINEYGPTEATVGSSGFALDLNAPLPQSGSNGLSIGRPIDNTQIYIVDKAGMLCPVGITGELCIGGAGVAKGYLNRPELTTEKFIANPFGQGRLYRTGDLARWLPDGNLEYLGRMDDQVKLRGYRIEPGEVEHVLAESPGVKQAVVVVSTATHPRLIGYVVATENYNREAVQHFLSSKLPAYMVPSLLVELDSIPLTPNGKVDRKQLAALEHTAAKNKEYTAPRNEPEAALAAIWEQLLNVTPIGIDDNFFELGGDSIITVQVVSRARRCGYYFEVADIFNHQTIGQLAAFISQATITTAVVGEQGELNGASGLLPIQQWYLAHNGSNPAVSHYNQSVLLSIGKEVNAQQLSIALKQLLSHHDALRFTYQRLAADTWQQYYGNHAGQLVTADLREAAVTDFESMVTTIADRYQQSLDIFKGDLVRMVWIQSPPGVQHNRLLVIVHHLAIDGVSWRILLEDLEALLKGQVSLGLKTSAYRQWYEALFGYPFMAQQRYWQQVHSRYVPLPVDNNEEAGLLMNQMAHCHLKLQAEPTRALLQEIPKVYHTEVNDILLCALAITLSEWTGRPANHIGLEGHGRENLGAGIDTSRTLGWFTSMFPVELAVHHSHLGKQLLSIKEQLRQVPLKGLGYGVLKYLHKLEPLQGKDSWDLVFNYLGQTDNVLRETGLLSGASEATGPNRAASLTSSALLEINSMVSAGELHVHWSYSSKHYHSSTVDRLAARYLQVLQELISHCRSAAAVAVDSRIPADYGLSGDVSYEEFDAFLSQHSYRTTLSGLYRLSPLQEGILFHGLYDGAAGAYVEQFSCEITQLDEAVFMAAWQHLLERHSILRSGFFADAFSVPVQCVYNKVQLPVERLDYRLLTAEEQQQQLSAYLSNDRARGFNFRQAPLMRLALIRLSDTRYYLLWTSHHLILDGWSTPVLMEEFLQTYELLINGGALPPLAEDRYEDYIRYIGAIDKQAAEDYWRAYLAGIEEPTLLPFVKDGINRTKGVGVYRQELLTLDRDETAAIEQFCRQHRITVNTLMQGVWSYLLYRYTGNASVTYGVTVSGRPEDLPGIEQRVGLYTNTLPLRVHIDEKTEIVSWLQKMQADQQQRLRYQYNSLSELQDWSGTGGELFDTMLTFQNYPVSEVINSRHWQLHIDHFSIHEQTSNYPLSLRIVGTDQLTVQFIYKEVSIDNFYIKRILAHFEHVLDQLLSGPVNRLNLLQLLPETEMQELLLTFNNTRAAYPQGTGMLEMFAAQVKARPHEIALVFEEDTLSYKELDECSNQLAHYLIARGVVAETLVPLCANRGMAMIVCMLGILKAGGAYVPLDPSYPAERLQYMLKDTGASLVLTDGQNRNHEGISGATLLLDLDAEADVIKTYPSTATEVTIDEQQLAYVIYTSGSTGRPKGVMIAHRGIINLIHNQEEPLRLQAGIKVLQFASISFDASCHEIFCTLMHGGQLILASKETLLNAELLSLLMKKHGVELVTLPPSYQAVVKDDLPGLRTVISAGEALDKKLAVEMQQKGIEVINAYGPTENTVSAILSRSPLYDSNTITIGKPLANVQAYILDEQLRPVPVGVPGELHLGGAQLARGYLNRPDLTAERFIENPFGEGRLYRTGDLARWLPNGNVEYLGRSDDQIKIRGYRIEPGEVERVLQECAGVKQGVVVVTADMNKRLIGYVEKDEHYDKETVVAYLAGRLPDYMVPSLLIEVDSIPVTANGKIDRRRLSTLVKDFDKDKGQETPRNEMETLLAGIWSELLEAPHVGINDNFFELGGHSLLAIRLLATIRKKLNIEIDIKEIFDNPTIGALSAILHKEKQTAVLPTVQHYETQFPVPLSFSQERLWFIDRLRGSEQYHISNVLRLRGPLQVNALAASFKTIVTRHEALRTVIKEEDGRAMQIIKNAGAWEMNQLDYQQMLAEAPNVASYVTGLGTKFDLSQDYMLRVWLIRVTDLEHVMIVIMHHIASDGWSMHVLVKELVELYNSQLEGRRPRLGGLPVNYAGYAIWQRRHYGEKLIYDQLQYWKTQLGALEPLAMPTAFPYPAMRTGKGGTVKCLLAGDLTASLKALSKKEDATLFMTLLCAFKVLLHRYTGQEDIAVGSPVAGRQQQELEELIGFFVNTIVLRNRVDDSLVFTQLLHDIKRTALAAYTNQDAPFEKVVEVLEVPRELNRHPVFQILFVVQNGPEVKEVGLKDIEVNAEDIERNDAKYDLAFDLAETTAGLEVTVTYATDLYTPETAERMLAHYEQLLNSIVNEPSAVVGSLQMLTPEETRILHAFNDTAVDYGKEETVIDLFASQVAMRPAETALIFMDRSLSYRELDERSGKLAHYLKIKGVGHGSLVPVCLNRGMEMIVAILGILKAGGAYVPLDPSYPAARLRYMLKDTAAVMVVTDAANKFHAGLQETAMIIDLDEISDATGLLPAVGVCERIPAGTLAYVIYTSGSTGDPKGVMIEHAGFYNMVRSHIDFLSLAPGYRILQFASISFDGSCQEIFNTLCSGGSLVIASREEILSPSLLGELLVKQKVYMATLPPSYQSAMLQELSSLQVLYSAGEAMHPAIGKAIAQKGIKLINGYGPTENTVTATLSTAPLLGNGLVTIGKPIHNVQVYICDHGLRICPVGITGELCIGGAGVAKGYLNRPELTKEKFIANPFGQGRLYRTGDLARWLPDGNLEYLGRMDDQVKLRGYRIEPGEVEHVLAESPGVKQAVVVVSTATHPRLIGYVVAAENYNSEAVQHFLSSKLPAYMVPSLLVELDSIPLTHNGKVDRKQLAALEHTAAKNKEYTAPRNEPEAALAAIWEQLLNVTPIGIDDNFFELGGDSIITIQVVSRARQQGIALQPRDIFNHQTIGQLAAFIAQATINTAVNGEQGELNGTSGLLPVQQWYLAHNGANPAVSHYNQSVLLSIGKEVNAQQLSIALKQLLSHHDALRFTYQRLAADTWQQYYGNHAGQLVTADLREAAVTDFESMVTTIADRYQQSLDIFKGDLVRMVWIQSPPGVQHNRLLVIVHHLAIDGVSWRILLEDLEALLKGQVSLGTKTSAYRQWYEALFGYPFMAQQRYWQQVHSRYVPLPVDNNEEAGLLMNQMAHCHLKLQAELTRALLQEIPKVYHTEVNDILLCALAITLSEWTGRPANHIGLEGHGRENLGAGIDTSRTLGWFTSMYPVELAVHHSEAGKQLLSIKEQLRQVPLKGLGYGVLKYLHKLEPLQGKDSWDLVFNYLGQTDNVLRETGLLSGASEATGPNRAASLTSSALLEINSMVSAGELHVHWSYSSKHYHSSTIDRLAARYLQVLQELISHCRSAAAAVDSRIPADYGLSGDVSYEEFDAFLSQHSYRTTLSGLYRLSPLQEGILFHGLYDGAAGAYVEQFSCEITQLDEAVFMAAWQHLLERHSILRSGFFADAFSVPVQCVYNKVQLPVERLDYRLLTAEEQQQQLSAYLSSDRARGFNFRQAPLMRLALIRLSDTRYYLLWTSHHLILDGWSTPVLMEEFLQTYELLINGGALPPLAEDRYEDYIRYIGAIDKQAAEDYWRAYLAGIEEPTLLPFVKDGINRTKGVGVYRQELLTLDRDETAAIEQFCRQHRITVNTLMQGVWSYLLYRYTGNASVTYGVTVSGRPEDLPGIEQKIGLYINSLPLHTRINEADDIATWLQSIQAAQLQSRLYQYCALNDLQHWSEAGSELFDTVLTFQNYPVSEVVHARAWALQVENININEQTNYPLSIVIGAAAQLTIRFNYNASLLETQYIKLIGAHFTHVLKQIVTNEYGNISRLSLLTPEEEVKLQTFTVSTVAYPGNKTMVDLFEEQVSKTPDAVAIVFEEQCLSYRELNERANILAAYLRNRGVKENCLVPVCVDRSLEVLITLLGILKSGGAYVPVESGYPEERIAYILEDTQCKVCFVDGSLRNKSLAGFHHVEFISVKDNWDSIAAGEVPGNYNYSRPSDLVYTIYTSGSTGKPKGVMIEHHALTDHVYGVIERAELQACRSFALFASLVADAGHSMLFSAFTLGATVHVLSDELLMDGERVAAYFEKEAIDCLKIVPSLWSSYFENGKAPLPQKVFIFGGEAYPPAINNMLLQAGYAGDVYNHYGPTEITIGKTLYKVDLSKNYKNVPIGSPFSNTAMYILDEKLRLCPVGVTGELYVGGNGIARGYLNQPELTTGRFIKDIFSRQAEARLYKTGDLVRWLPNGNIEYLGRRDDQVKIRGNRIELGEVQHVLEEAPGVKQAVVLVNERNPGNRHLAAYVVPEGEFDRNAINAYLKSRLPAYMIPAFLVQIDSIPLTSIGKINKKALPGIDVNEWVAGNYVAPFTELEKLLADIWKGLLKVEKVGVKENFFELGGNSLLAIRMSAHIRKRCQVSVPVHVLFRFTTISDLSKYMELEMDTDFGKEDTTVYKVFNI